MFEYVVRRPWDGTSNPAETLGTIVAANFDDAVRMATETWNVRNPLVICYGPHYGR